MDIFEKLDIIENIKLRNKKLKKQNFYILSDINNPYIYEYYNKKSYWEYLYTNYNINIEEDYYKMINIMYNDVEWCKYYINSLHFDTGIKGCINDYIFMEQNNITKINKNHFLIKNVCNEIELCKYINIIMKMNYYYLVFTTGRKINRNCIVRKILIYYTSNYEYDKVKYEPVKHETVLIEFFERILNNLLNNYILHNRRPTTNPSRVKQKTRLN